MEYRHLYSLNAEVEIEKKEPAWVEEMRKCLYELKAPKRQISHADESEQNPLWKRPIKRVKKIEFSETDGRLDPKPDN